MLIALALLVFAQTKVQIKDEGVALGTVSTLNCSGAGITCTVDPSTRTGTLEIAAGTGGGVPATIPAITYAATADLSAERVLSAGNYTTIDNATAAESQVDWAHGLTCAAGAVLTSSGTTAMACVSNVATATALAANPADCAANQYATAINASGTLACEQVTIATTAAALTADPAACPAGEYVKDMTAAGVLSCATPAGANALEQSVAVNGAGIYSQAVIGQAWVTATSKIVCGLLGSTSDGLTPEAIAVAGLVVTVSDRSAGVGFALWLYSPHGLTGTVRVHCIGV